MCFRGPRFAGVWRPVLPRCCPSKIPLLDPSWLPFHRFIDAGGWLAGLLAGWMAWLGWMSAEVGEDDEEEEFQGILTRSSLEELGGFH